MTASRFHPVRVTRVIEETADARSFVLRPAAEDVALFAYRAGQFLTLEVPFQGRPLHRSYSFSSSPDWDDELKITVKRIDEGRVSHWLNDSLREGDTLAVIPPAGRFVLRDHDGPLLLFAAGSGITPVISLAKTALITTTREVRLGYANRDRGSVIFEAALNAIAERYPERFEVVYRFDDSDGFLDAATVTRVAAERPDADFYLCGPEAFMTLIEHALAETGIPRDHVFIERFASPSDGELPDAAQAVAAPPAAGDAVPEAIEVRLGGESRRVSYRPGQTILQAARDGGMDAPSACEEGFCATCVARLLEGSASMAVNDVLTDAEVEEGLVLTCQAKPTSASVVVEYEE